MKHGLRNFVFLGICVQSVFHLWLITLFLVSPAVAQIPTNNLTPVFSAVMVNSSNAVVAPAAFWNSNATAISAAIDGGGLGNTNSIPNGATYSAGNDPNTGQPFYFVHVIPNTWYFANFTNDNDNLVSWNTNSADGNFSITAEIDGSGFFKPTNQWVYLVGTGNSSVVGVSIYPSNPPVAGTFYGNFTGAIGAASSIPNSALTNVQLLNAPLNIGAQGSAPGYIFSSNNTTGGGNGSTLTLHHMGAAGYADINFTTEPYNAGNYQNDATYNLQFALGVTDPSSTLFPYAAGPYLELYNPAVQSFFWLHAGYGSSGGGYIGGVRSNAFFISQDGSTNRDAFVVYPAGAGAGTPGITNYLNVTCVSNVTVNSLTVTSAPTLQATNAGVGITIGSTAPKLFFAVTNNGVAYKIPAY